jgi:hypothetical protein
MLAEYLRTFIDSPLQKIPFVNLQNEFECGRDDVNNLCLQTNVHLPIRQKPNLSTYSVIYSHRKKLNQFNLFLISMHAQ